MTWQRASLGVVLVVTLGCGGKARERPDTHDLAMGAGGGSGEAADGAGTGAGGSSGGAGGTTGGSDVGGTTATAGGSSAGGTAATAGDATVISCATSVVRSGGETIESDGVRDYTCSFDLPVVAEPVGAGDRAITILVERSSGRASYLERNDSCENGDGSGFRVRGDQFDLCPVTCANLVGLRGLTMTITVCA